MWSDKERNRDALSLRIVTDTAAAMIIETKKQPLTLGEGRHRDSERFRDLVSQHLLEDVYTRIRGEAEMSTLTQ